MAKTLAIVTCYHHPEWTHESIEILASQDCDIVVVNNRPDRGLDEEQWVGCGTWDTWCTYASIKDIYRMHENLGPPCRFLPALALFHEYDWILFADEDLRLSSNCIETLENAAQRCREEWGKFSTLGVVGRRYAGRQAEWAYGRRNVRRQPETFIPVDLTCRLHFIEAHRVVCAITAKRAVHRLGAGAELLWEDDMLLNHGIQMETGAPSYLLPSEMAITEGDRGGRRRKEASSARPEHLNNRNQMIRYFAMTGWRPPCSEA